MKATLPIGFKYNRLGRVKGHSFPIVERKRSTGSQTCSIQINRANNANCLSLALVFSDQIIVTEQLSIISIYHYRHNSLHLEYIVGSLKDENGPTNWEEHTSANGIAPGYMRANNIRFDCFPSRTNYEKEVKRKKWDVPPHHGHRFTYDHFKKRLHEVELPKNDQLKSIFAYLINKNFDKYDAEIIRLTKQFQERLVAPTSIQELLTKQFQELNGG